MTAVPVQYEAVISDLKIQLFGRTVCKILYGTAADRKHAMAPEADHVVPMNISPQLKKCMAVVAQQRPLHAAATDEFTQGTIDRGQRHARQGCIHPFENVFGCQWHTDFTQNLENDATIPGHPKSLQLSRNLTPARLVPARRVHDITSLTGTV
jgi:hypothetical protein